MLLGIVYDVIEYEEKHRYDKRHSQTTLADDRSERSADKEKHQTGKRQCELLLQFYAVAAYGLAFVGQGIAFEFVVLTLSLGLLQSGLQVTQCICRC